jgi:hypothetical protein
MHLCAPSPLLAREQRIILLLQAGWLSTNDARLLLGASQATTELAMWGISPAPRGRVGQISGNDGAATVRGSVRKSAKLKFFIGS